MVSKRRRPYIHGKLQVLQTNLQLFTKAIETVLLVVLIGAHKEIACTALAPPPPHPALSLSLFSTASLTALSFPCLQQLIKQPLAPPPRLSCSLRSLLLSPTDPLPRSLSHTAPFPLPYVLLSFSLLPLLVPPFSFPYRTCSPFPSCYYPLCSLLSLSPTQPTLRSIKLLLFFFVRQMVTSLDNFPLKQ